ncbi:MAG: hypothetical protein IJ426_01845 [Clostridia bacterium]|nr:hypothetical protein [Clostridia bacterium]
MLGYIKAYKPELRMKEYEMYKAVYCSLCKDMGKRYGFLTRFTLSYDFTFLALLNMSLSEGVCSVKSGRCVCNPLKKCTFCKGAEHDLSMPSAASVIMVYYNIRDNVADERGLKRLFYRFLSLVFRRAHKKAAADYPDIENAVKKYVTKQSEIEASGKYDIDAAAAPTSEVLSYLFPLCSVDESDKRALERLGYCLGRFIYLADARVDLEKDRKRGNFNPLLGCEDGAERAERNIYMCINESINAFELINIRQYKNILGNIIYMGLEDTYKRSLNNERSV